VPALRGRSLREELNAATPIREGGSLFHGHTKWHVDWHFQTMLLPSGRCGIDDVQTQLTATITLPGPTDPAIAQNPQFLNYVAALKRHEQGHFEIGRHAALLIDQGILTLPSEDDCPRMEQAANDFAQAQLAAARDAELRYDRDTGNGRTQGAALN
jgi:predicted secreted Zn-dependent protease